jgi:hypothetical protein
MKKSSLLLCLGSLLALPLPAMAAMTEMADSELADVSGQAYVMDFGRYKHAIPDLTERDIVLVSDSARYIEADYPLLTGLARQGTVTATNAAIVSGKTAAIASMATVPGVGTVVVPILSLLPTPKIGFE